MAMLRCNGRARVASARGQEEPLKSIPPCVRSTPDSCLSCCTSENFRGVPLTYRRKSSTIAQDV